MGGPKIISKRAFLEHHVISVQKILCVLNCLVCYRDSEKENMLKKGHLKFLLL